ncbi:SDR family NAD(P)-dependent oxidoreductase [Aeromicrobium sp. UC242_57]|uniref:SDR family NAD(P)-dependent oxidoreductase n=1 Tax=Aeromicrobium sp. UC242_57 TaxID=3374624 RepID=UPI00379DEA70
MALVKAWPGPAIPSGARVILTDLSLEHATATAESIGPDVAARRLDVTDPDSWQELEAWLGSTTGSPDVLVNNAGLLILGSVDTIPADAVRQMTEVNVIGPLLGIQMFVRMNQAEADPRPGSIVNISSVRGLAGGHSFGGYCASKFGVRGLTKAAAVELGALGIRVNTVCPGPIETPMSKTNPDFKNLDWDAYLSNLPLGHIGQPHDIGHAVAWLGSDRSAFVTGVDLPVDGGLTATTHNVTSKAAPGEI